MLSMQPYTTWTFRKGYVKRNPLNLIFIKLHTCQTAFIGAVDWTLIPIKGMTSPDEPAYVCRKNFHALNIQAVADANMRLIHLWISLCYPFKEVCFFQICNRLNLQCRYMYIQSHISSFRNWYINAISTYNLYCI